LLADTIAKKLIGGVLTTERKFVEGSDRRRNDSTTKSVFGIAVAVVVVV